MLTRIRWDGRHGRLSRLLALGAESPASTSTRRRAAEHVPPSARALRSTAFASTVARNCCTTRASLHQRRAPALARGRRPTLRHLANARALPPRAARARPKHRQFFTLGIEMATSIPAPPDADRRPRPRHECSSRSLRKSTRIDDLIGIARHSIRVFDIDLSGTGWNARRAAERIVAFLRANAKRAARHRRSRHGLDRALVPATDSPSFRGSRSRDHDPTDPAKKRKQRDGSADDRRRPALPASAAHFKKQRAVLGIAEPGRGKAARSSGSKRSGRAHGAGVSATVLGL